MQQERARSSLVTIVVLLACATVVDLQLRGEIDSYFLRNGGYAQNGHVEEAIGLFYQMRLGGVKPDLITWTAIIAGYAHNGNSDEALKFFHQMQLSGIKPNVISWTAIITGHAQSSHCDKAPEHFCEMELVGIRLDMISWNAMIEAYAQNSHWDEAMGFFRQMQIAGLTPNAVTIATALTACANLAALQQGKEIHNYTIRMGSDNNSFVGSSLLDMYAKCGNIESARQVFDGISHRNLVL
jgi:pentatricopeptide repeat protein